ncbi:MAG TPA: hypothetical protein VD962_02300 [Rubricoccaceae bacterium]|nr:hypothetical protein [Rubricoccaceae bacterium]
MARFLFLAVLTLALTGCDALFGSKGDDVTDEILDEGQTDPTLPDEVGYVPLTPFYTQGALGALDAPQDVYVGYDELLYVVDRQGLHVLDLAGRPQGFLGEIGWPGQAPQSLRDVEAVVQDRRLDVYIAARRDTTVAGAACNRYPGEPERCDLPVVYRISGLTTGTPQLVDIIWHVFDDGSRRFTRFDTPGRYVAGGNTYYDEDARFTGVAPLFDNRVYITRSGPVNDTQSGRPNQTFSPFNAFLVYTAEGEYVQFVRALSPTQPSLLSAVWPSDVMTFVGPPQRTTFPASSDFLIAQAPPSGPVRYGVLSVRVVETPDGTEFRVDTEKLSIAANPDAGDGFLYEEFKFERPVSLAFAADATGYTFVLDAGKDSLFVFTRTGVEGVSPPPGAPSLRPVRVSFGGTGGGPLQFREPMGVAYFDRTVYVADTGNNRIGRYRLNTDFE